MKLLISVLTMQRGPVCAYKAYTILGLSQGQLSPLASRRAAVMHPSDAQEQNRSAAGAGRGGVGGVRK